MEPDSEFTADVTDAARLLSQVGELRQVRAELAASPDPASLLALVDTALIELEWAASVLAVLGDRRQRADGVAMARPHEQERTLLRAVLSALPVPVFVLEGAGIVRRANPAAADLLGVPSGYTTGRPLSVFADPAARTVLGTHVAAVARDRRTRGLTTTLLRSGRRIRCRMSLLPLELSHATRPLTIAVCEVAAPSPEAARRHADVTAGSSPRSGEAGPDAMEVTSAFLAALGTASQRDGRTLLRQAGQALLAHLADWAVIDMIEPEAEFLRGDPVSAGGPNDPEPVPRAASANRVFADGRSVRGRPAHELLTAAGSGAELVWRVCRTGQPVWRAHLEDPAWLGVTADGAPLLGALGVSCLAAVPVGRGDRPSAVVVLMRAAGRAEFTLPEQRFVEDLADHLGLVLELILAGSGPSEWPQVGPPSAAEPAEWPDELSAG